VGRIATAMDVTMMGNMKLNELKQLILSNQKAKEILPMILTFLTLLMCGGANAKRRNA